jgi:DNA replication and repair protein RecF
MGILSLWLNDFRCFREVSLAPDPVGLTVLRGDNGTGKTSVLEAVGLLITRRSLRGAPREAMVRRGCRRAVVRAEVEGTRRAVLEAELPADGPLRLWCNRQPVRSTSQVSDVLAVSVFSPDDLALVRGGPEQRRRFLDQALAARLARHEALVAEVERVLRQRGALLRQAGGHAGTEVARSLDVWDSRLADAGEELVAAREELVEQLGPALGDAYRELAGGAGAGGGETLVTLRYRRSWSGSLAGALAAARQEDLRRQLTTVGPHRDELDVVLDGRPARTEASQGEQRTIALALRLAAHLLDTAQRGQPPVLLLDDVFSELDNRRAAALVEQLPAGQVLLTTAVDPPPAVAVDRVVEVGAGRLQAAGAGS